jgi:hypothetical protein
VDELLTFFFWVVFFVFIWAGTGHLLWMAISWAIGCVFATRCRDCNRKFFGDACPQCRTSKSSASPTDIRDDLRSAERLVKYARFREWLGDGEWSVLQEQLQRLEVRLNDKATTVLAARTVDTTLPPIVAAALIPVATVTPPMIHPLDQEPAAAPVRKNTARITFADMLQSFMERSNIRWVELISAALIVICSVGLVISLWNTLSSTSRFFPSFIFLIATLAVHLAGQYTLRQWKLRTTSRGILHIGLMLIPLAVLVGMLLAHRDEGSASLEAMTWGVLAIGSLTYGSLAVTTSRTLFSSRWGLVASVIITACVTLLPIHFASQSIVDRSWSSAMVLLPLTAISAVVSVLLSRLSMRLICSSAWPRLIGMLMQCLFATAVVFVFWLITAGSAEGLSSWWWIAVGTLAAGWTAWGWTVHSTACTVQRGLSSKAATQTQAPTKGRGTVRSGFLTIGWIATSVCGLLLLVSVWFSAEIRWTVVTLMLLTGLLWQCHGWVCRLPDSSLAGICSLLLAVAFILEAPTAFTLPISADEWLSFQRVLSMSCVGLGAVLLARALSAFAPQRSQPSAPYASPVENDGITIPRTTDLGFINRPRLSPASAVELLTWNTGPLAWSGCLLVAVSAVLTLIASLAPFGPTPWGGEWAGGMLCVYGLLLMLAAIAFADRKTSVSTMGWKILMPLSQLLLLLGAIRLSQTLLPRLTWFDELQTIRHGAFGGALLAAVWGWSAAGLRAFRESRQGWNIQCLAGASIPLTLASALVLWTNGEGVNMAVRVGWMLPLTWLGVALAYRLTIYRELLLLSAAAWFATCIYALGSRYQWWMELGPMAGCGLAATMIYLLVAGVDRLLDGLPGLNHPEPKEVIEHADTAWNWNSRWAMPWLGWGSWALILIAGALPCFKHLSACWGLEFLDATESEWWFNQLNNRGSLILLASAIILSACCWWQAARHRNWGLVASLGLLPILLTMGVLAWVSPPYSLVAALWTLTTLWIVGEWVWEMGGGEVLSRLRPAMLENRQQWGSQLLPLAGGLMAEALVLLTISQIPFMLALNLPEALQPASADGWRVNLMKTLLMLGPFALAGISHWCWGVQRGRKALRVTTPAVATSLALAASVALAMPQRLAGDAYDAWQVLPAGFGVMAVIMPLFAWCSLFAVAVRNMLGLRGMSGAALAWSTLLEKSLKGGRYKYAEGIAWQLSIAGLIPIVFLVTHATVAVIGFPIYTLTGVAWLGSWLVMLAVVVNVPLYWYLCHRRGMPHSHLVAIIFGMLAPISGSFYASMLAIRPELAHPAAAGFEPWRSMQIVWLLVLFGGLLMRIQLTLRLLSGRTPQATLDSIPSNSMDATTTRWSDALWVGLATCVTILAFVGLRQDPNVVWPMVQLSTLAILGAFSGIVSGQAWRGHLAAILAAASVAGWLLSYPPTAPFFSIVHVMWGPVAVGLVSAIFRQWWYAAAQQSVAPQRVADKSSSAASPLPSVEMTTSLLVPLCLSLFSLLFVLTYSWVGSGASTWLWWTMGLSACTWLLSLTRLWEPSSNKRGLAFYLTVINLCLYIALGLGEFNQLSSLHRQMLWLTALLAGMAIMAALLRELSREASALRLHLRLGSVTHGSQFQHALGWMPQLHTAISLLSLLPCFALVLALPEQTLRVAATALPLLGASAVLPIAANRASNFFRYCGLLFASSTLLLLFWAQLPEPFVATVWPDTWLFLQRTFLAGTVLCLGQLAWSYTLSSAPRWTRALVVMSWLSGAAAGLTGCMMLLSAIPSVAPEMQLFVAQLDLPSKLLTLAGWLMLAGRALWFAVKPHPVEATASTAARKGAVFLAEGALIGMGIATWLHFPTLFTGLFLTWWPVIVLGIALLSAALGELLRRMQQSILSDPVHQSSLLLPLIPLAGVGWILPSNADWVWAQWSGYSLLLLGAALLYALHGWTRDSLGLRALAGGLTLFSFWSFLQNYPSLRFLEHPQFWLVPPAAAALLFVEWNRQRLNSQALSATRYVCLLVAYLSSASEVLLKAFEGQIWQPMVLLALALLGFGLGIALRVKAFMLSGSVFIFVALLGMVWHAQQAIGQVWPWWAFGIATGVSLIVCLGYFEKNRQTVLEQIDRWKQWEN